MLSDLFVSNKLATEVAFFVFHFETPCVCVSFSGVSVQVDSEFTTMDSLFQFQMKVARKHDCLILLLRLLRIRNYSSYIKNP